MNATAAPTAKAPELSFEELGELVLKGKATPAEKADFLKQLEVKEKAVQARSGNIAKIKTEIEKLHKESPFEKDEWIDLLGEVYQAVAGHFNKSGSGAKTAKASTTATVTKREKVEYPSDSNEILFHFPSSGAQGDKVYSYHKGRIFETYKNDPANKFIFSEQQKKFAPAKLKANGQSVADLFKFLPTDEAQQAAAVKHLKSSEGAKEVAAILNHLNGTELKQDAVAKDIAAALDPAKSKKAA
jgi:anthranilate phosphoribosyltransferase